MSTLVMLRHGESEWNKANRFTGWTDVGLSDNGVQEAIKAALILSSGTFSFYVVYTSYLKRAIKTAWIVMEEMDRMWVPVIRSWRLNERHYGALQGLNKAETAEKYGKEQVHIWRRSFDVAPPPLDKDDPRHPSHDHKYDNVEDMVYPACESLKDTLERTIPYWKLVISQELQAGKNVLVCAHGNSLRALIKHIDQVSDEDIPGVEIPTGAPLVYNFDRNMRPSEGEYVK